MLIFLLRVQACAVKNGCLMVEKRKDFIGLFMLKFQHEDQTYNRPQPCKGYAYKLGEEMHEISTEYMHSGQGKVSDLYEFQTVIHRVVGWVCYSSSIAVIIT